MKLVEAGGEKTKLPVILVVGPTASGKTEVAIELAKRTGAEIVSADSRQIYQQLTIGTAKPTEAQLQEVTHHFIDYLPLREEYSAGQFSRDARKKIATLQHQNKSTVVVGGSGMYIDALLNGFFQPIAADKKLQKKLKERARLEGSDVLHAELEKIDPERAAELPPLDAHRIVRSLEIFYATGEKHSDLLQTPRIPADFPFMQFALNWPRSILYKRIENRVDVMLEQGLLEEVKSLLAHGMAKDNNALLTVGYREVIQYLDGDLDYKMMVDKIKQHTRNYAKRQVTWFKRDSRIQWIDCAEKSIDDMVGEILLHVQDKPE
ncbi:MAG: tRNA (adenosine(37)-N6)-dimethylallyltransferase MiaA [Deferribacteres bacterium]|nr:tRNA (adenosine(37)-N6)-dimethylallyltransferase MiaA [candidate division KSB1 bacterium]MCB9502151.1 tRNA (adenosine(37)-N6)-dimethylallyltransferase MiaA [Deferribacteres bacterium]